MKDAQDINNAFRSYQVHDPIMAIKQDPDIPFCSKGSMMTHGPSVVCVLPAVDEMKDLTLFEALNRLLTLAF